MCVRVCTCVNEIEGQNADGWEVPVVYASYLLSDDNTSAAFGNRPLYTIISAD